MCGEESYGTGSDHVREKDGLWAVLFWLNWKLTLATVLFLSAFGGAMALGHPIGATGAMLIGTGVGHFLAPKPFDTIVPAELPGDARFYTYASGVAEVGVGAMLLVPRTRRAGGRL
mgnify:CR=1 FL=1